MSDDIAIINTVDFFPPIVDDPYTFGLIAAIFLPAFSEKSKGKEHTKSYISAFILIVTYFVISVVINVVDIGTFLPVDYVITRTLFLLNNGHFLLGLNYYTRKMKTKNHIFFYR